VCPKRTAFWGRDAAVGQLDSWLIGSCRRLSATTTVFPKRMAPWGRDAAVGQLDSRWWIGSRRRLSDITTVLPKRMAPWGRDAAVGQLDSWWIGSLGASTGRLAEAVALMRIMVGLLFLKAF
jgi:hypothetical protein